MAFMKHLRDYSTKSGWQNNYHPGYPIHYGSVSFFWGIDRPAESGYFETLVEHCTMSTDLSPQNEQFIEQVFTRGVFHNRTEALDEAVELLRRRQELLDHIDEGTRQLRNGEGITLRGEDELGAFFDGIQADGLRRYEQCKNTR
jgi:Arc/MetJ-type ribon-helix-helix transcriptional regulator